VRPTSLWHQSESWVLVLFVRFRPLPRTELVSSYTARSRPTPRRQCPSRALLP